MISKTSQIITLNLLLLTCHPRNILVLSAPLNQMMQPLPMMPYGYFPYPIYPQYQNNRSPIQNQYNNNNFEDNNSIEVDNSVNNVMLRQNPITNPIGTLIMWIPFLPIHINVPDAINAVSAGIQAILGTVGQRIPFVSNWFPAITAMPQQGPVAPILSTRNAFVGQSEQNNIVQPPMFFLVPFNNRQAKSLDVKIN